MAGLSPRWLRRCARRGVAARHRACFLFGFFDRSADSNRIPPEAPASGGSRLELDTSRRKRRKTLS